MTFEPTKTGADLLALVEAAPRALIGHQLRVSQLIPEWQIFLFGSQYAGADAMVGPLTFWYLNHDFKLPMVSMCSRGMRELERDRRKHR